MSALNYQLFVVLHEFDGRAVWITDVYDSLSGVRTRPKSLRFTGSFPTRRVDRAQNRVEIIDDERDVREANIAGPQIDIPLTLERRENRPRKISPRFAPRSTLCIGPAGVSGTPYQYLFLPRPC